jgi:MFS family permease
MRVVPDLPRSLSWPRRPGRPSPLPRRLFGGLPREVGILSAVSFTVALGYGIVAPAIPAFARQFGVSTTAAAGVISAFALMRIVGALPAGRLVERIGERRTMAAGITIVAVSSVLAGLSGSFTELLVLRGVGGLGSAMFGVSAQTLLLRTVAADQRGRASGLYSGGFLLGSISGPAIGGLIAAWSLRAPFFVYGVMLIIPAGIAFVVLRDRSSRPPDPGSGVGQAGPGQPRSRVFREIGQVLRSRGYRAAAAANLADGFAVLGVRSAIVPLFVHYVLHRSAIWTGISFGIVAALNGAALLPAGWVADRFGRRPVIVGGCLTSAAGMILLAGGAGLGGLLAAMAVLGIGSGLLDVAPSALIGDLLGQLSRDTDQPDQEPDGAAADQTRRRGGGAVVASYQMAGDIGAVTGPLAVGFLVDSVSYDAAFGLAAAILAAAACFGLAAPPFRGSGGVPAGEGPPAEGPGAEGPAGEGPPAEGPAGEQPDQEHASARATAAMSDREREIRD